MKMILKSALVAAAMAGAATLISMPASAGVGITIGIGVPSSGFVGYGPGYSPYDNDYYYEPIYVGGSWYHGPYRWQMQNGHRVFWMNGRWVSNEWNGGPYPASIVFSNGGYYRSGRYDGFGDADRINARFHSDNRNIQQNRQQMRRDQQQINQDRRRNRRDRQQMQDNQDNGHHN